MSSNPLKKRRYPFKRQLRRKLRRFLFILVAAVLASAVNYFQSDKSTSTPDSTNTSTTHKRPSVQYFTDKQQQQAIKSLQKAANNTGARFWVGMNAEIVQILKDDLIGSRHQKFIISPKKGITLLVSHNIDLAKRVSVSKGDHISLYGRYEWNHRGGVIHWTHHDPSGKKSGGWIRANNKVYR